MIAAAVFAIPGDINLPTGGYAYDRRVLALLPESGVAVRHVELPGTFPEPSDSDLVETGRLLAAVAPQTPLIIDGLAYGAMPADLVARIAQPIIALVHHPLFLEAGLSKAREDHLYATEKAALAHAKRIIVVSNDGARALGEAFAVPRDKITVAEPGTDPAARATGTGTPLQLLSVGSIVPRKAYDLLVRALAPLQETNWRLTIAGAPDRSKQAAAALAEAIQATGLAERITLTGAVGSAELARLYAATDLFVLASLYEGYGMVLAEAMARGLPIVCTTGGAAADTAPDGAALKVPPGDQAAMTAAIARVLEDRALRRRMADASWAAGQKLPRWEDTARRVAAVVRELCA